MRGGRQDSEAASKPVQLFPLQKWIPILKDGGNARPANGSKAFIELPSTVRRFSYEELLVGTQNLSASLLVGRGGFGPVYRLKAAGLEFAVKVGTNLPDAGVGQGRHEFENEALLLWLWKHPRIVSLAGVSEGQFPCLVYEYMPGGSLSSVIHDARRAAQFGPLKRLMVAADVANALMYLHEGGRGVKPVNKKVKRAVVLHRDINSSNVLLDENGRGKLGDFGLSAMLHEIDVDSGMVMSGNQVVGQWAWSAPEAQELGNMAASDIYSFGLILLQMLSGCEDSILPTVRISAAMPGTDPVLDDRLAPHDPWPAVISEAVSSTGVHV
eukprot:766850-Hanusia_phi.AAC.3